MNAFKFFKPISVQRSKFRTLDQNFNLRRDPQKKSYERRAYESVDEKSLF